MCVAVMPLFEARSVKVERDQRFKVKRVFLFFSLSLVLKPGRGSGYRLNSLPLFFIISIGNPNYYLMEKEKG
jgi:hypothetical protein